MRSLKSIDYGTVLLVSLRCTYASGGFLDVKEIAKEQKLPSAFLEKIAQRFKQAGVLESRRGAGGGYRLCKDPAAISIETIIALLESPFQYCPLTRNLAVKLPNE